MPCSLFSQRVDNLTTLRDKLYQAFRHVRECRGSVTCVLEFLVSHAVGLRGFVGGRCVRGLGAKSPHPRSLYACRRPPLWPGLRDKFDTKGSIVGKRRRFRAQAGKIISGGHKKRRLRLVMQVGAALDQHAKRFNFVGPGRDHQSHLVCAPRPVHLRIFAGYRAESLAANLIAVMLSH